jgi:hypothetical protein
MSIRDVFYIILIVLIGLSINNFLKIKERGLPAIFQFGGKAHYFIDTKEADFDKRGSLDIQNSHGKIELISWDQETIKAELEKVIYTNDEKRAEEISEKIQLSLRQEEDTTKIYTNRAEVPFRGLNVRTNMKIYLPAETSTLVALSHGDMILYDMKGNFKIEARHSDIELGNIIGNVFVHEEYGNLLLKSIEGPVNVHLSQAESVISMIHDRVTINMEHSSLELENNLSDVIISARHSEIEAHEIKGNFRADCENTEIYAHQIGGDVLITNSHKDITLSDIAGQLKIDSEHCDIEAKRVSLNVIILSEYGEIVFGIPSNMSFSVDLMARNGDIDSDFESLSPVEESRGTSLTGRIGEGGPLYKIETSYNEIYLEELTAD